MTELQIIDMHNHVYATAELGRRNQEVLGKQATRDGTVEELLELDQRAGISHAAMMLFLSAGRMYERRALDLPPGGKERAKATRELKEMLTQRITRYNDWGVQVAAEHSQLLPFVGVDPVIMGREALINELEDKLGKGAKGVKIHPGNIGIYLNDPRLWPVYDFCNRTGLPLLTQTGAGGLQRDIGGFDPMGRVSYLKYALEEFKDLKVIAAHFNLGCPPEDVVELARKYPGFHTDISNQLDRWGQPGNWTTDEGVSWIRKAGVEKVVFGSNYLTQDPVSLAQKMRQLPMSSTELEKIANGNAKALLGIA